MNPNILILPIRILETILFSIIAILIYRQFPKKGLTERPLVNTLYFLGIISWIVYIIADCLIYIIAPLSFNPSIPMTMTGYNIAYPSLFFANLLRDIAMIGVYFQVLFYLGTAIAIKYGELRFSQIISSKVLKIITIILISVLVINDKITVIITPELIIVTESWNGIAGFSLFLTIFFYNFSASLLYRYLSNAIHNERDTISPNEIKKIRCFYWGIFFNGFGYIWALFWNVVATIQPSLYTLELFLIVSYFLHTFWIISPILIYRGIILGKSEQKTQPVDIFIEKWVEE